MYNSSKQRANKYKEFTEEREVDGHIFFNDMSKNYMRDEFKKCDVIYSEPAWVKGYSIFNDRAKNIPNEYSDYMNNINKLCECLGVPAFIVSGKFGKHYFKNAQYQYIHLVTQDADLGDATVYIWNYDIEKLRDIKTTIQLTDYLSGIFECCLDFSSGYGHHLMKFKDFVACDIDKNCLTYLSVLYEERMFKNGKTEN